MVEAERIELSSKTVVPKTSTSVSSILILTRKDPEARYFLIQFDF